MNASSNQTWRLHHIPALDGLRGVAVLGVIAFHAERLRGGYLGVDLFFVLSGFLITSLLLGERARDGTVRLTSFWGRRIRRLMPALLMVLLAVAVYTAGWASQAERAAFRADGLATLFYVANWKAIFGHSTYWAMFEAPSPLQHTWSLAIEEQFYLLWPLVVAGLLVWWGRSARSLFLVCVGGAVVSASAMGVLFDEADTTRSYFGTDTRIAAILAGAALATALHLWGHVRSDSARRLVDIVALVGVGWLAYAWLFLGGQEPLLYRGGFVLSQLAVVAIIASITHGRSVLGRALSWRPICWVGLVSYGLYLWHWPVFVVADSTRLHLDGWPLLAAQLAIVVMIAAASYYLVERPIRRGALDARPARVLAIAAPMVTVALIVGVTMGGGTTSADDVAASLALSPDGLTADPGTDVAKGAEGGRSSNSVPPRVAARQSIGRSPRVLIVGDSVAFTLAAGIVPYQQQLGVQARSEAIIACGVARGDGRMRLADGTILVETPVCHGWPERWTDAIAAFQPDVIILTVGWPGHTSRFIEGEWRQPCDPIFDRWYEGEVSTALEVLHRSGRTVAMTTVPYYRSPKAPPGTDEKTDCLNRLYRNLMTRTDTKPIDLAGHICPAGACRSEQDGITLRPDGLHFDGPAGPLVGVWVLDEALRGI